MISGSMMIVASTQGSFKFRLNQKESVEPPELTVISNVTVYSLNVEKSIEENEQSPVLVVKLAFVEPSSRSHKSYPIGPEIIVHEYVIAHSAGDTTNGLTTKVAEPEYM